MRYVAPLLVILAAETLFDAREARAQEGDYGPTGVPGDSMKGCAE